MSAGHILHALWRRSGLSQKEIEFMTGVTEQTISSLVNNDNLEHLPPKYVRAFLDALVGHGVPPIQRDEVLALAEPWIRSLAASNHSGAQGKEQSMFDRKTIEACIDRLPHPVEQTGEAPPYVKGWLRGIDECRSALEEMLRTVSEQERSG